MKPLINVTNLTKSFKGNVVVHGINFDVQTGEILCLLGPNGAGKSTTINILVGALKADTGSIEYQGTSIYTNLSAYKSRLGIVPQDLALYEDLTAEANVNFFASLYGLKGSALAEGCRFAMEFTGLADKAKQKVNTFSGGMKRRLNIACAIAHHPEILIMDEPTVGIDPQSRNHILEGVKTLCEQGMTIVYTTHYMEEVEAISTRIIIMDEGHIIAEGTATQLKADIESEHQYRIKVDNTDHLKADELLQINGVLKVATDSDMISITSDSACENLDKIISTLTAGGMHINDISCQTSSLETVFLNLTGKSLRD